MAETLRIFVSATKDLEAERAVIGRLVAELPVRIGVEIRRTPISGASYETMHELISNCDRVYFLLGRDITAPAGVEWHLAWQLERSVFPLRQVNRLTPAGQAFLQAAPLGWTRFRSDAELTQIVGRDLMDRLLHPANRYGLTVHEVERLQRRRLQLTPGVPGLYPEPGGAEGGGILLDELRREPLGGTPLD